MRIDLSGKSALVTGSMRDIGLATARQLASTWAAVIASGRTQAGVERPPDSAENEERGGMPAPVGSIHKAYRVRSVLLSCIHGMSAPH
jgi:NAD(P)-dependent dehydrogenase (short-subunit alcohol dehydrogenase family)